MAAYVAVDGDENIFHKKPRRINVIDVKEYSYWEPAPRDWGERSSKIPLPPGSINKLIGRELTWEDEPVELV